MVQNKVKVDVSAIGMLPWVQPMPSYGFCIFHEMLPKGVNKEIELLSGIGRYYGIFTNLTPPGNIREFSQNLDSLAIQLLRFEKITAIRILDMNFFFDISQVVAGHYLVDDGWETSEIRALDQIEKSEFNLSILKYRAMTEGDFRVRYESRK